MNSEEEVHNLTEKCWICFINKINPYLRKHTFVVISYPFGVMVFSATFNNILAYRGGNFCWWRKQE